MLFGEPIILEKLLDLQFEISMESFFQTNPKSAERLYSKELAYATVTRVSVSYYNLNMSTTSLCYRSMYKFNPQ